MWLLTRIFVCFLLVIPFINIVLAWGSDKNRLEDVKTLTLYHGKMTTGRRASPVPQMKCVGGSAGCSAFVPQVVQCYNRGSDGTDVQWECKTDMDNAFRFGRVQVICEGYDYPDDPYVLKGSCGLEYTLDLTKEGMNRKSGHDYYQREYGTSYQGTKEKSSFGDIILIAIVLLIIYAIYKTCLRQNQFSRTNDDFNDSNRPFGTGTGYGYPGASAPPPPAGFRTDYRQDEGCGASNMGYGHQPTGGGAGNFWTGAMTGGVLGYMFGNRNRGYSGYEPMSNRSWGGFSGSSSSSPPSSSGTRTASGFGGTSRR